MFIVMNLWPRKRFVYDIVATVLMLYYDNKRYKKIATIKYFW